MRRFLVLLVALSGVGGAPAFARAETLPPLTAKDLAGRTVDLSARSTGSAGVFIVGFTKASSDACQAWEDRLWGVYGKDPACRVFSVLELQGVPGFLMPWITHSVRGKTPQERWGRVFLARQGKEAWKKNMAFDAAFPDDTYLALVDGKGTLVWKGHGPPAEELEAALKGAVDRAESSGR